MLWFTRIFLVLAAVKGAVLNGVEFEIQGYQVRIPGLLLAMPCFPVRPGMHVGAVYVLTRDAPSAKLCCHIEAQSV